MRREIITTCAICGHLVRSLVAADWRPSEKAQQAQTDMQEHLVTHSFAQLLRYEIRQDLNEVPDEQRPSIVRDIYRGLLGTTHGTRYTLDPADGRGVYSIDEALGSVSLFALWRTANSCGDPNCRQDHA